MGSGQLDQEKKHRGFPLVAILLLTTSTACALACIDVIQLRESIQKEAYEVLAICCGTGLLVGIIGGIIGFFSISRWRGLVGGLLIGFLAGGVIGLFIMAPAHPLQAFCATVVLVVASLAFKWNAL
ncbi:MAG: hypothetical protein JW829_01085 [Pirellulales bacterium]|nr:hypothetical protein [Pirellulales bacterium]